MHHLSPVLFEAVANKAILRMRAGDFNAQSLANTVNAVGEMDHLSPVLFEAVAKEAILRMNAGDFNAQNLLMANWIM